MIKRQRNSKGFTIIEVMIVLAIAGLIMLIVFLAVPTLQRTSRNTQRKQDVAAILAAMGDYANNNGGALPSATTCFSVAAGTLTISCNATDADSTAKLGYYTAAKLALSAPGSVTAADTVTVYEGTKCSSATAAAAGGARQIAALYGIESGSGYNLQCQES